ncbi:MAG: hypothetical protein RR957_07050, partial [Oscillospiraceae bacterium]
MRKSFKSFIAVILSMTVVLTSVFVIATETEALKVAQEPTLTMIATEDFEGTTTFTGTNVTTEKVM